MQTTITHTLDWDHIWSDSTTTGIRLYLHIAGEEVSLVHAAHLNGTSPLTGAEYADVQQSFEDNRDSGFDFASEATEVKPTLAEAKRILRPLGVTLACEDGEYRVNLRGSKEVTAYYTEDINDAIDTGKAMAAHKTAQKEGK